MFPSRNQVHNIPMYVQISRNIGVLTWVRGSVRHLAAHLAPEKCVLVLVRSKCVLFFLLVIQSCPWELRGALAGGFFRFSGHGCSCLTLAFSSQWKIGGESVACSHVLSWGPIKVPVFHVTTINRFPSLLPIWRFFKLQPGSSI